MSQASFFNFQNRKKLFETGKKHSGCCGQMLLCTTWPTALHEWISTPVLRSHIQSWTVEVNWSILLTGRSLPDVYDTAFVFITSTYKWPMLVCKSCENIMFSFCSLEMCSFSCVGVAVALQVAFRPQHERNKQNWTWIRMNVQDLRFREHHWRSLLVL